MGHHVSALDRLFLQGGAKAHTQANGCSNCRPHQNLYFSIISLRQAQSSDPLYLLSEFVVGRWECSMVQLDGGRNLEGGGSRNARTVEQIQVYRMEYRAKFLSLAYIISGFGNLVYSLETQFCDWNPFVYCFWFLSYLMYSCPSLLAPWPLTYSASRGQIGGLLLTWIPPRFFSSLSWNGSAQPPSDSGVASHKRSK